MYDLKEKAEIKDSAESEYSEPVRRIIAIASQKGGVGKSTSVINIAAFLGHYGYKTIIVDMDPQSNSTIGLGVDYSKLDISNYNILVSNDNPNNAIVETSFKNLRILPANWKLSDAEADLGTLNGKEFRLRDALNKIEWDYDFIIIDCPPYLGLLTTNVFTAADEIIIPMQCEYFALEGVGRFINIVDSIRETYNLRLKIAGAVLTMYSKTRLADQAAQEIREYFEGNVYKTIIPKNVRLGEAVSFGRPIVDYDPRCKGALAYSALTKEIIGDGNIRPVVENSKLPSRIRNFWSVGSQPRHAIKRRKKVRQH